MMYYVPSLQIMETSQNIRNFVNENKGALFEIFKPLAPYIVGLILIDNPLTYRHPGEGRDPYNGAVRNKGR